MKENSYKELMKSSSMNKKKLKEDYILQLYIDMFLSEILLNVEKEKLLAKIDQSIDEQNYEKFKHLSTEYKELCKRFGT